MRRHRETRLRIAVGGTAGVCYHPPPMRLVLLILAALLLAVPLACSPAPVPLARVHGTVTVNGQPLRGGTIVFAPDRQRGGRGDVAHAVIAADGTFELTSGPDRGAAPGWHRITVAPPADAVALSERLEKFRYPDLSGLSREVKAGADNA